MAESMTANAANRKTNYLAVSAMLWHMYLFSSGVTIFTPQIKPFVRVLFSPHLTFPSLRQVDADDEHKN